MLGGNRAPWVFCVASLQTTLGAVFAGLSWCGHCQDKHRVPAAPCLLPSCGIFHWFSTSSVVYPDLCAKNDLCLLQRRYLLRVLPARILISSFSPSGCQCSPVQSLQQCVSMDMWVLVHAVSCRCPRRVVDEVQPPFTGSFVMCSWITMILVSKFLLTPCQLFSGNIIYAPPSVEPAPPLS